jgi:iron(III) transport system ATP-binding protein
MFLQLRNITKRFGAVTAVRKVSLDIEEGLFVCFVGPSGCGKTTLLRLIAGLEEPDEGDILLHGRDLTGLPARKRNFGMVFQSYSLFPNMTVAENIAYGLETRHWTRDALSARVREMLALVQLDDQAHKLPHQLSGGQQQRVALARALAPEPRVLLLDEPLSALDAKVREELRGEIRSLQSKVGVTTIMVTHDQDEAMEMADRIVVLNAGVIEQIGTAVELYNAPATRFVAEFIGRMNIVALPGGQGGAFAALRPQGGIDGDRNLIGVRPEHIQWVSGQDAGDAFIGEIERSVFLGNVTRVTVAVEGQRLLVELPGAATDIGPGTRLSLRIPPEAVHRLAERRPPGGED